MPRQSGLHVSEHFTWFPVYSSQAGRGVVRLRVIVHEPTLRGFEAYVRMTEKRDYILVHPTVLDVPFT